MMLKKMMDKLFFTCEHASYLVEKDKMDRLPPLQRFRYWVHLQYCKACLNFKKQSDRLDSILAVFLNMERRNRKFKKLDKASKEAMRKRLEEKVKT